MMEKRKFAAWGLALGAAVLLAGFLIHGCRRGEEKKPAPAPQVQEPARARDVQAPVFSGSFYPSDPKQLKDMIAGFLAKAQVPQLEGRPFGFMVPHAGYVYSGPVAAYAYKMIKDTGIKRFVMLGPSHRVGFQGVFVLDKDAYRTPLGEVGIDRESAKKLIAARPWLISNPELYEAEHSLEVQLPFLQEAVGDGLSITIVMIGEVSDEQTGELAQVLSEVFPGDDVIFLASTDMSHGNYPPYMGTEEIRPADMRTLEQIKSMDVKSVEQGVRSRRTPLCGGIAVVTLMKLFQARGGEEVRVLKYGDSGDSTGDHSRVVGYGAVVFLLPAGEKTEVEPTPESSERTGSYRLSEEEKKELLQMARACVEAAVKKEIIPRFETGSTKLREIGAAFVTLKTRGSLRGCIGTIIPTEPLYLCVQRRAVDAAIHDSRFVFNPIRPDELGNIDIEISVLTPVERVQSPEQIVVGRDGVLLTLGSFRGVFLPQVPVEQGWDRDQYLSHLCGKAGISDPNCYLSPQAVLERFQAIVFSEQELGP